MIFRIDLRQLSQKSKNVFRSIRQILHSLVLLGIGGLVAHKMKVLYLIIIIKMVMVLVMMVVTVVLHFHLMILVMMALHFHLMMAMVVIMYKVRGKDEKISF